MPVPTSLDQLSTNPADNSPAGSESVFPNLDDYLRTNFAFIAQLREIVYPVGSLLFTDERTAPDGFLELDGDVVLVASYARLVEKVYVGDAQNSTADYYYRCTDPANPTTTRSISGNYFKLKDARGEYMRGFDGGRGVDPGRVWATMQAGQVLSHSHTGTALAAGEHVHGVNDPGHAHFYSGRSVSDPGNYGSGPGSNSIDSFTGGATTGVSIQSGGVHPHTLAINATGGTENLVRNFTALVCIKY